MNDEPIRMPTSEEVVMDERELDKHFAFGENWEAYSRDVSESQVAEARRELKRLLGRESIAGLRLIDIGCGSGIHAVAAAQIGAHVRAVDIDPHSVEAARRLVARFGVQQQIDLEVWSIFDEVEHAGLYDIVYSWGVLHHTGDMWGAVRRAADLVKPDGELVISLYRRTRFCRFWAREKRFYSRSPRWIQGAIRIPYTVATDAARLLRGTTPWSYRREYVRNRGMRVKHDIHDWLGGYPYQSASPWEVRSFLGDLGYEEQASFVRNDTSLPWQPFSSGCDEYRFRRVGP